MSVQAVGMDLGTTFSGVAIVGSDGRAHAIPNAEGMLTTPSVVIWYNDAFLVGLPALDLVKRSVGVEREQLAAALIRGVKSYMSDPPLRGLTSNGHHTTHVEVSAAILAKLARDASKHLGFHVQDVVITVPAHFGDRERTFTKSAAEMAGLHVLQIINEPSAAALTYSYGQQVEDGVVLVFDLGGGTFDATLLDYTAKESKVLATQGIEELGGINFTTTLAQALQRQYEARTGTPYPQDSQVYDVLINEAEAAKCRLSTMMTTDVQLPSPQGTLIPLTIIRTQFEDEIDLFIMQLQVAVEMVVERAKKKPTDVTRVLLCGGSSRIPSIQTMLTDLFGRPPEQIIDLDLSVALGAAYKAAQLEQTRQSSGLQMLPGGLLVDCVSYPVGLALLDAGGSNWTKLVMLNPGDPLDTWSAPYAVRIRGNATNFPPIAVYKGDGSQLSTADYLGDIALTLPPSTPADARATVQMLQDQSGLVRVRLMLEGKELPGQLNRV